MFASETDSSIQCNEWSWRPVISSLLDLVLEFGKLKAAVQVLSIQIAMELSKFWGILSTDFPGPERLRHHESRKRASILWILIKGRAHFVNVRVDLLGDLSPQKR